MSDEKRIPILICLLGSKCTWQEWEDCPRVLHIEFECQEEPCRCDEVLRRWRMNLSKMPK